MQDKISYFDQSLGRLQETICYLSDKKNFTASCQLEQSEIDQYENCRLYLYKIEELIKSLRHLSYLYNKSGIEFTSKIQDAFYDKETNKNKDPFETLTTLLNIANEQCVIYTDKQKNRFSLEEVSKLLVRVSCYLLMLSIIYAWALFIVFLVGLNISFPMTIPLIAGAALLVSFCSLHSLYQNIFQKNLFTETVIDDHLYQLNEALNKENKLFIKLQVKTKEGEILTIKDLIKEKLGSDTNYENASKFIFFKCVDVNLQENETANKAFRHKYTQVVKDELDMEVMPPSITI